MNGPQYLTQTQIIKRTQFLINTNDGDVGRLYHILEYLKRNKPLYYSDQKYLENKLNTMFIKIDDEKPKENKTLGQIQNLINSGNGDPGRLQHIYDMLSRNKPLYRSDQVYLENQLATNNYTLKNDEINFNEKTEYGTDNAREFKQEIKPVEPKHERTTTIPQKLRGLMPKDWKPPENKLSELHGIYEKIKTEELLNEQQKIYDEITLQRSKLSQIILNRKDYEKQVLLEKTLLDSQIKEEHINIQTQTKLSEQILLQKEELEKVKLERNQLMKKINNEKDMVSKDLHDQKSQLEQIKLEQEAIENQIKQEQISLSQIIHDQKYNLLRQVKIAREIKEKQIDLEKTKKEYEEIMSQVNKEQTELDESEKLKKLIKFQEKDLIKAKEERLKINELLTKEKENISKKTKEEQEKLQIQSVLVKQLENEKQILAQIKQKREKIEKEIKIKKQKLKERQQKIKKQITEKNIELKSLNTKSKNQTQKKSRSRKSIKDTRADTL